MWWTDTVWSCPTAKYDFLGCHAMPPTGWPRETVDRCVFLMLEKKYSKWLSLCPEKSAWSFRKTQVTEFPIVTTLGLWMNFEHVLVVCWKYEPLDPVSKKKSFCPTLIFWLSSWVAQQLRRLTLRWSTGLVTKLFSSFVATVFLPAARLVNIWRSVFLLFWCCYWTKPSDTWTIQCPCFAQLPVKNTFAGLHNAETRALQRREKIPVNEASLFCPPGKFNDLLLSCKSEYQSIWLVCRPAMGDILTDLMTSCLVCFLATGAILERSHTMTSDLTAADINVLLYNDQSADISYRKCSLPMPSSWRDV